jgi:hypothetical protein
MKTILLMPNCLFLNVQLLYQYYHKIKKSLFIKGTWSSDFAAGALGDSIRFGIFVIYQFHPGN